MLLCQYFLKDGPGPQHYVKARKGRAEHVTFIISALDGCEYLADCFGHSRGKSVGGAHLLGLWNQEPTGLDGTMKIKMSSPSYGLVPAYHPEGSHFTA
jgi:hypothetical protein